MVLYTDSPPYGQALLPPGSVGELARCGTWPEPERPLLQALFGSDAALHAADLHEPGWRHVLATDCSRGSQYDRLIELARRAGVPDRIACVSKTGTGFHGFKGRSWSAEPGNIHLAVHFAPDRSIERFDTAFTTLAAVAVVQAIDKVPGLAGRAAIKWVNDVLIDGAKVAGVIAYTQSSGPTVRSAVLGIGLNVEATPAVDRSGHVPAAGSLRELAPGSGAITSATVLHHLLDRLARLYDRLLGDGVRPVMDEYRSRSAIIGREVRICEDDGTAPGRILAEGRVTAIGDGLEIYLAGRDEPVTRGRLILAGTPLAVPVAGA
jgi:BirA family transcriptional regulator, biotin operon repressor / biotin---[acetyl-CoA-carboxylase] ligase